MPALNNFRAGIFLNYKYRSVSLCMRDPEATRRLIISSASILFNTKGYKATSLSDITTKAGITKGAIYKHFESKSHLERSCLKKMTSDLFKQISIGIKSANDAKSKLFAVLDYFSLYGSKPPFEGGCPLMNAAIEVDDSDPVLKALVAKIMLSIQDGIATVVQNGIEHRQLSNDFDVRDFSTLFYSAIEGGLMMMMVTDDDQYLQSVIRSLRKEITKKCI